MSRYSEYFLASSSSIVQLELLDVIHPNFTKVYRIVRNAIDGVDVTLEPGPPGNGAVVHYDYYPLRITSLGHKDNLDSGLKIELGDLGQVLPLELDAVAAAGGFEIKPTVIYRTYRSDDLTQPLFGPLTLQIVEFTFNKEGAMFEAKAPSLNVTQTGETYSIARFPMLRGFIA